MKLSQVALLTVTLYATQAAAIPIKNVTVAVSDETSITEQAIEVSIPRNSVGLKVDEPINEELRRVDEDWIDEVEEYARQFDE